MAPAPCAKFHFSDKPHWAPHTTYQWVYLPPLFHGKNILSGPMKDVGIQSLCKDMHWKAFEFYCSLLFVNYKNVLLRVMRDYTHMIIWQRSKKWSFNVQCSKFLVVATKFASQRFYSYLLVEGLSKEPCSLFISPTYLHVLYLTCCVKSQF